MNKKIAYVAIAVVVVLAIAGGAYYAVVTQPPSPVTVKFAHGAGVWTPLAALIQNITSAKAPYITMVLSPGGGLINIINVNNGTADLGLGYLTAIDAIKTGGSIYGVQLVPAGMTNVRALWRWEGDQIIHIFVTKSVAEKYNITSFEDIISKKLPLRWTFFYTGSAVEVMGRVFLAAYGVTYDDLKSWGGTVSTLSTAELTKAFKDGQADIFIGTLGTPQSWILDISTSVRLKFLGISPSMMQKLQSVGFKTGVIKAGTYPDVTSDLTMPADTTVVVARADLPERVVYDIVKAVFENRDQIANWNPLYTINPQKAGTDLAGLVHPGAAKYYAEKGYPVS